MGIEAFQSSRAPFSPLSPGSASLFSGARMRHVLLLAGVLGGGLPAIALAQTAVPTFEETLVVSASLDSENREDVPASVTVVDAEEIEARQVDSLSEAVSLVPGVTVAQAGGPRREAGSKSKRKRKRKL